MEMQFRDLTHLSSLCVEYWCCKLQARNFFLYCKKKSKELGSEALSRTGRAKVSYPEGFFSFLYLKKLKFQKYMAVSKNNVF